MNASTIEAAGHHPAFRRNTHPLQGLSAPTRRASLANSTPASRGEGSWLAALMIALALLALWAWLRLT